MWLVRSCPITGQLLKNGFCPAIGQEVEKWRDFLLQDSTKWNLKILTEKGECDMEEKKKAMENLVQLPEGYMRAECCSDCRYHGRYDSSDGRYWCGWHDKWVYGGDSCGAFKPL